LNSSKKDLNGLYKGLHGWVLMIAGDLIMQLLPQAFDWLFIMHLQGVGSHNYSAASGLRLRTL